MARKKRRRRRPRRNKDRPDVNDEIRASKVRIIYPDEADREHEVVPIERAREIAASYGDDLVEVAPNAEPPVCKVMDFGKYMYKKKKKEKRARKKQHTVQVKELRFRPNTDDHDIAFKMRHARGFLEDGNKVKATVQFRGRDMLYTDRGKELLLDLAEELDDLSEIETRPKLEGRRMHMMLIPHKNN